MVDKNWYAQCEAFDKWVEENCPSDSDDDATWEKFYKECTKRMPAFWNGMAGAAASADEEE